MWRLASAVNDEAIVRMRLALNAEDPGLAPVSAENPRRTLQTLCEMPLRGRAVVLELEGGVCGYALLIACWSNQLGAEICVMDEMYVEPDHRGQGHATRLIDDLATGAVLWASNAAALALEVSPGNQRARRLDESMGFRARNLAICRRLRD